MTTLEQLEAVKKILTVTLDSARNEAKAARESGDTWLNGYSIGEAVATAGALGALQFAMEQIAAETQENN